MQWILRNWTVGAEAVHLLRIGAIDHDSSAGVIHTTLLLHISELLVEEAKLNLTLGHPAYTVYGRSKD